MAKHLIVLEINSCKERPNRVEKNPWSSDGWDRMIDWFCTKSVPERKIAGAVEWQEEKKIAVPDWCPISVDKPKNT